MEGLPDLVAVAVHRGDQAARTAGDEVRVHGLHQAPSFGIKL